MRENIAIDDKNTGETRRYSFDWTPCLADGDTPVGEPRHEVLYGVVEVESNTLAANVETFVLSGGEVGPTALRIEIDTTQNELLEATLTLNIL